MDSPPDVHAVRDKLPSWSSRRPFFIASELVRIRTWPTQLPVWLRWLGIAWVVYTVAWFVALMATPRSAHPVRDSGFSRARSQLRCPPPYACGASLNRALVGYGRLTRGRRPKVGSVTLATRYEPDPRRISRRGPALGPDRVGEHRTEPSSRLRESALLGPPDPRCQLRPRLPGRSMGPSPQTARSKQIDGEISPLSNRVN